MNHICTGTVLLRITVTTLAGIISPLNFHYGRFTWNSFENLKYNLCKLNIKCNIPNNNKKLIFILYHIFCPTSPPLPQWKILIYLKPVFCYHRLCAASSSYCSVITSHSSATEHWCNRSKTALWGMAWLHLHASNKVQVSVSQRQVCYPSSFCHSTVEVFNHSGMLCGIGWQFVTEILGQCMSPIFGVKAG